MPAITREKFVNALVEFAEEEIIRPLDPSLSKSVGVILDTAVHYLAANRQILSKILENDIVSAIVGYNPVDDTFSIEDLTTFLRASIEQHEGFMFTLNFPKIPFIDLGSEAIKVKMSVADFDNLVRKMQ